MNAAYRLDPSPSSREETTAAPDEERRGPVALADLASLQVGLSPRHTKLNDGHVRALIEVLDQLPPILVHRASNTVIDGAHRLEAFRRCGRDAIPARCVEGDLAEAFVLAVDANVRHGLPLTTSERKRAAALILADFPSRSDRWIGQRCGLSYTTVARVRMEVAAATGQPVSAVRIGRDGRRRLSRGPGSPPSENERYASPKTPHPAGASRRQDDGGIGRSPQFGHLADDPALSTASGLDHFMEWLTASSIVDADWTDVIDKLPVGRLYDLADECKTRAEGWERLRAALERRAQRAHRTPSGEAG